MESVILQVRFPTNILVTANEVERIYAEKYGKKNGRKTVTLHTPEKSDKESLPTTSTAIADNNDSSNVNTNPNSSSSPTTTTTTTTTTTAICPKAESKDSSGDKMLKLLYDLKEKDEYKDLMDHPFCCKDYYEKAFTVTYTCKGWDIVDQIIVEITSLGIGTKFGSYKVWPLTRHVETEKKSTLTNQQSQNPQPVHVEDLGIKHLLIGAQIRAGAAWNWDFVMLVMAASTLAGVALALNNTVVIVASMLVSPIMGPILGIVFGIRTRDCSLVGWSILSEIGALLFCILVGMILAVVMPPDVTDQWPQPEMADRGTASGLLVGIAIAVPSGFGVALSVLGNNIASLVGVAISAALLPPTVNCGICWMHGIITSQRKFVVFGSFSLLLTLVNIGCIILTALILFQIKLRYFKFKGKTTYLSWLDDQTEDIPDGTGYETLDTQDMENLRLRMQIARKLMQGTGESNATLNNLTMHHATKKSMLPTLAALFEEPVPDARASTVRFSTRGSKSSQGSKKKNGN